MTARLTVGFQNAVSNGFTGTPAQYCSQNYKDYLDKEKTTAEALVDIGVSAHTLSLEGYVSTMEAGIDPLLFTDEEELLKFLHNYKRMQALADIVSKLNPNYPGIGAGMLKDLVARACAIVDGL